MQDPLFCEIPCLTEQHFLSGLLLQRKWFKHSEKRFMGQVLQKFVSYNSSLLDFLGVNVKVLGNDANSTLEFKTSSFVGAIPLRAPDTGKQIGDFFVAPRFTNRYDEYSEIVTLLNDEIIIESVPSLPLQSGRGFKPPFYLEAIKYVKLFEKLINYKWIKFQNLKTVKSLPVGKVNWKRYAELSYKTERTIKYPTQVNELSISHAEFRALRYVFDLAVNEIRSHATPNSIKTAVKSTIEKLNSVVYNIEPITVPVFLKKNSDPIIVAKCKEQANKILMRQTKDLTAWRTDFNVLFERFVQHIFSIISKENGGKLLTNLKIRAHKNISYPWRLANLEPDAVYVHNDMVAIIEAKYKSNLFNKYSTSEFIKSEFRKDIHQLLAYSSFAKQPRLSFLCYPSNKIEIEQIEYENTSNNEKNTLYVVGIPLRKLDINPCKQNLAALLQTKTPAHF